jgi:hypothetical protein
VSQDIRWYKKPMEYGTEERKNDGVDEKYEMKVPYA